MTGTANAVNGPEAAPYLAKAGGTMTGALTLNSSSPASDLIAASKGYVDSVAQGLNPKPASDAASTAALTVTYNNGSGGIGATLTNAGAMAAFSIDGYSASVGDVILIKDQASSLQNGLYTVTTVGSGAVNWVLTRSTSMDQPSEFKGGYTFVINGTVNSGRSYVETAVVTTVGTDAVTFAQFSQSKQLSVVQQIFTANGTYTPTTGMTYAMIEVVGSGAGGGGGQGVAATSSGAGGGGGGGAYSRSIKTAAQVGASQTVTIGAGGAAGTTGNPGGNGNASSVGTLVTANGGTGGNNGPAIAGADFGGAGGAGGSTGGTGDFKIAGSIGGAGLVVSGVGQVACPGAGGKAFFSPGGNFNRGAPAAGVLYGGGGDGAYAGGANASGMAGADGVVVITEFVFT